MSQSPVSDEVDHTSKDALSQCTAQLNHTRPPRPLEHPDPLSGCKGHSQGQQNKRGRAVLQGPPGVAHAANEPPLLHLRWPLTEPLHIFPKEMSRFERCSTSSKSEIKQSHIMCSILSSCNIKYGRVKLYAQKNDLNSKRKSNSVPNMTAFSRYPP